MYKYRRLILLILLPFIVFSLYLLEKNTHFIHFGHKPHARPLDETPVDPVLDPPHHVPDPVEIPKTEPSPVELPPTHKEDVPVSQVQPVDISTHPIHQLIEKAGGEFKSLQSRQSQSLKDAVAEYRRRYKLPPPPHFDKWYNFATERGVQMIDEYDTIYDMLIPFWALEPALIRERTREVVGFDNAVITIMIRDGKVTLSEGGGDIYKWHREALPGMIDSFIQHLPDMDLAFNVHDEPRIVMQHSDLAQHLAIAKDKNAPRAFANSDLQNVWSAPGSDLGLGDRIKEYRNTRFNRFAHQPTWSNSKMSCPPDSAAQVCFNDSCPDNIAAYTNLPLGFLENTTAFSDICNSPSLQDHYGFFIRPNAFDVAHELFPIFSQSKVSSFQDILYPSPWYYEGRAKYDKSRDYNWDEKDNKMYWRGSTTGGFSRDGDWRKQHRQRFLTKIQPLGDTSILKYDTNSTPPHWTETTVPMKDMEHYFDVKLTYVGQCDPGDCEAQTEYFGVSKHVNMNDAFQCKYLLDIDGNAFSGRYHSWLLSRSLVYKLALFREWHDEWLKPWLHYVPLSLKGDEYVESIRYFDQEETGKVEAKKLADEGRGWAEKVLRNDDLEVWFFRLLLEYGRLIDDNRYDIGFSL